MISFSVLSGAGQHPSGCFGMKDMKARRRESFQHHRLEDNTVTEASVFELDGVVVQQDVPALDLLVFVLQAFVPVLQRLTFSLNT